MQDLSEPENHQKSGAAKREYLAAGQEHSFDSEAGKDQKGDEEVTKWSWIGPRSPLMGEKDESEWLLEKLFARLEWSLKEHWDEHKREQESAEGQKQKAQDEKVTHLGTDARQQTHKLDQDQYQKGIDKATEGRGRQRG